MDLLVFSHLRWDFVYQRPQHLLSRFAKSHRVFFWEEPEFGDFGVADLKTGKREDGLTVVVPQLPIGTSEQESWNLQQELLQEFVAEHGVRNYLAWYYTPMARNFTRDLDPIAVVYDCMDELSAFRGAPPGLTVAEKELLDAADLVFTGGQSLYESKKSRHHSVHLFPSSIDARHFATARTLKVEPKDQTGIPRPRLGYCGVIDERMDLMLLAGAADLRPEWQFVMIGPVVKISDSALPRRANIHYLGSKRYAELPAYMAGWDAGLLPFARNESTRYISPTKTPEYLAAGLPVISTPIKDVVRPYGEGGFVAIADDAQELVRAAESLLTRDRGREQERLKKVDAFLSRSSWDRTFAEMQSLICEVVSRVESARNSAAQGIPGTVAAAD